MKDSKAPLFVHPIPPRCEVARKKNEIVQNGWRMAIAKGFGVHPITAEPRRQFELDEYAKYG